jgi:hypothetical protein
MKCMECAEINEIYMRGTSPYAFCGPPTLVLVPILYHQPLVLPGLRFLAGAASSGALSRYVISAPLNASSLLLLAVLAWMAAMDSEDAQLGLKRAENPRRC